MSKKEEDWKKKLTEHEYEVMRNKGTEQPFKNEYFDLYDDGIYLCRGCGKELFSSSDKFNSNTGWPSFKKTVRENVCEYRDDYELGFKRVEVVCSGCESHIGHFFSEENPKRFCANSISLKFKPL